MASSAKQMPLHFFLLLLAFSSMIQIHARESQFFSKTTRSKQPKKAAAPTPPAEAPAADKKEETPALPTQSHNGYGLYGRGPDRFSPTMNGAYDTYNYNGGGRAKDNSFQSGYIPVGGEKLDENEEYHAVYNYGKQWRPESNSVPSRFSNVYERNNEEYHAVYNYGKQWRPEGNNVPSRFSNEYERNNEVDPNKQHGMSDTRFLDNGRYFYDVNAERRGNNPEGGYGTYNHGARTGNYYGKRYGYAYGHNNDMNEYQNNQLENEKNQEDYVP